MAYTLVEAAKYSNDKLQVGIIEKLVYDDPIFEKLKFKDIKGNGLTYNVETALPDINFYSVGETWTEDTHTVTQSTAVTKIMGGDVDVDNFLQVTRGNLQDITREAIDEKVKALKKTFYETFWYGNATTNAKKFDGLHTLIASTTSPYENTLALGSANTTPTGLNMSELETAIDYIKGFKPQLIVMAKPMRRAINTYLVGVGGISYGDAANRRVQTLFEVDVAVSDYLTVTENVNELYGSTYGHQGTTGDGTTGSDVGTSIFVLNFDDKGCSGLQSMPITIERIGVLETKDAKRTRIKWYPSLMLQSIISCSKVTGIDYDGAVAA